MCYERNINHMLNVNTLLRVGWLSSGMGEGSIRLFLSVMKAIKSGYINIKIEYVFCDREIGDSENIDLFIRSVKSYNIPLILFSSNKFKGNALSYNRQVWDRIGTFNSDFLIAAGYKRIIMEFLKKTIILNLHPALPTGPTGTWRKVILKLIEENTEHSGLMINRVTEDIDRGPVLTYCKFQISKSEFSSIRSEQIKRESVFMVETIKAISEKRINLHHPEALDITNLVDKAIR